MTQRNIKTIMAAIALIMASGVVQAAPYGQNYLSPPSHRLAYAVACEWVRDYRGNLYCVEIPSEQEFHVSPSR
ncbi:MAG: hypothetical protein WBQ53_11925 [Methylocystis sp.]